MGRVVRAVQEVLSVGHEVMKKRKGEGKVGGGGRERRGGRWERGVGEVRDEKGGRERGQR